MKIVEIYSSKTPRAIGPYSQAIKCANFIFCSGQIGMDPKTGLLVVGGIVSETKQVFRNLAAVLKAAGLNFNHVVKTDIFIADINNFVQVNEIYAAYFKNNPQPARQTVEVSKLPKNASIEISCIAYLD